LSKREAYLFGFFPMITEKGVREAASVACCLQSLLYLPMISSPGALKHDAESMKEP
jgi:hypothetical protein